MSPPSIHLGFLRRRPLTVQIIRRHKQLQTQLRRNFHIRYIFCVLVLLVVVQVFADLFKDYATAWTLVPRGRLGLTWG